MQLNKLHTTLLLTLCMLLTACNDQDVLVDNPNSSKTPIELSVGGVDVQEPATRAVITDGTNKTLKNFDKKTKVFILMQSDKEVDGSNNVVTHNGFEYKGDRPNTLYTVARGDVAANSSTLVFDENNKRYWDDAHARSSQLTMWAIAQKVAEDGKDGNWKSITFRTYGVSDDDTKPSIGDSSDATYNTNSRIDWQGTTPVYPAIFSWSVGNLPNAHQNQDEKTIIYQDLLFSNNISYNKEKSWSDRRLKFDFGTSKFPRENDVWETTTTKKTEMKFYHALSKITIQIKAGEGFNADGNDFKLKNNTIDKLIGFNTRGLFNIKDGEFQLIHTYDAVITTIPCTTTANTQGNTYYTLEALAIPNIHEFMSSQKDKNGNSLNKKDDYSRFVDGSTDVMMEITVDDNTYKITSDNLYDALMTRDGEGNITETPVTNATRKTDNDTYVPLEAGKNYVFTFTIGKTKINNISATVADWETVTSEYIQPSNAYVNLSLKTDEGTNVNSSDPKVDLYRAKDPTAYTGTDYNAWAQYSWATGYTAAGAKATLSQTSNNSTVYNALDASNSTQWYWPDNNTFYHFRTVNKGLTVTSGMNDVVSIYSGPINDTYSATDISASFADGKFNDYIWGAPFKSEVASNTIYSSAYGFCNNATAANGQLYKAIGATLGNILLIQHHMMSEIYVDVETTTGTDAVVMTNTTVKLVRYAKEAKIQMGNGLITGYSNYDNGTGTLMTTDVHSASGNIPAYDFSYRVVPQSMTNSSNGSGTTVGLEITTSDGNVYKILDLGQQTITGTETKISEWVPGKKYYYKFVLSKTGIANISATVVDWENITATTDNVQIQ